MINLDSKIRDIKHDPEKVFSKEISKLYEELKSKGITFRPRVYASDEWFSPDASPTIALPFYLLDKSLTLRAKKELKNDVEGTSKKDFMKLLRHECGHAIETAYNLKYSRTRQRHFGLFSKPYPSGFSPQYQKKGFVDYLGHGYGPSHPSEDFAETFALWLEHGEKAKDLYSEDPLTLSKITAMEKMMNNIKGKSAKNKSKKTYDSHKKMTSSISSFFLEKKAFFRTSEKNKIFKDIKIDTSKKILDSRKENSSAYKTFLIDLKAYRPKHYQSSEETSLLSSYNEYKRKNLHIIPM